MEGVLPFAHFSIYAFRGVLVLLKFSKSVFRARFLGECDR